ncbi:MAG: hypothetical protein FWC26_09020, partial [Fibromonadales bacterium]|nr:hypothetical protein [Fibromonadales bacterium]
DAALVKNETDAIYAIVFEGDECAQNGRITQAVINGMQVRAERVKRIAGASLYHLATLNDLKGEICETGEIQGATINTPLGKMTVADRNEKIVFRNGCVVAMKASDGLYINATELNIFASTILQAFYRIRTSCAATNVCGVGMVTANHCITSEKKDIEEFSDRSGNTITLTAIKADSANDYAIFPQQPGVCIPPAKESPKINETAYIQTMGKAGHKTVTTAFMGTNYKGDAFVISTASHGDSGSGVMNAQGEFLGHIITIDGDYVYMRNIWKSTSE